MKLTSSIASTFISLSLIGCTNLSKPNSLKNNYIKSTKLEEKIDYLGLTEQKIKRINEIFLSTYEINPMKDEISYYSNKDFIDEKDKTDYWQTPQETHKWKTGDCEDLTIYLWEKLNAEGLDFKIKHGFIRSGQATSHLWLERSKDGKRLILDPGLRKIFNPSKNSYLPIINNYFKHYIKDLISRMAEEQGTTFEEHFNF